MRLILSAQFGWGVQEYVPPALVLATSPIAAQARAKTLYVAPSGSDTASCGGQAAPCCAFRKFCGVDSGNSAVSQVNVVVAGKLVGGDVFGPHGGAIKA